MTEEARQRGSRAEAETQRRRRRGDEALAAAKRLPIPPEIQAKLDKDGLVPRWVNDQGNRMHRFTVQDDYDPVEGVEPVPVGTDEAGKPILAHLLAKRRDFIEDDRKAADDHRKEVEASLFRKPEDVDAAGKGSNPNPASVRRYVAPESKMGRANQVLDGG
jgi:hypothetical protein